MIPRSFRKRAGTVLVALLLASLLVIGAPQPAAAATGSVNPAEAPAGTRFHFAASGFTPGERVDFWVSPPRGPTITRYPAVDADASGAVVWSWDAPAGAEPGGYVMNARGVRSDSRAVISFRVVEGAPTPAPATSVSPASGPPGTRFSFSAAGFQPGERAGAWVIAPDGSNRELEPPVRGGLVADANGVVTWSHSSTAVASPGLWRTVVRGIDTSREVTISFTIEGTAPDAPTRSVTPPSGPPGTTFTVTAGGFTPGEELGSWLVGPDGQSRDGVAYLKADGSGSVTWQWTSPPSGPSGGWRAVTLGKDSGIQAVLDFTISGSSPGEAPPVTSGSVTPTVGEPGTEFTFSIAGFERTEEVGYWPTLPDGTPDTTRRVPIGTDGDGRATLTWVAPERAVSGTWVMTFQGISSNRELRIPFTIGNVGGVAPTVTPASGGPGTSFTFRAGGFNVIERIDTFFELPDGTRSNGPAGVRADGNGVAEWSWTAPTDALDGRWTLVAVGQDTDRTYRFDFTISGGVVPAPQASASPTSGPRGTTFTFTASGYLEGERVGYWFNAPDGAIIPAGREAGANADGVVTITWTAPADAAIGSWTIAIRSSQNDRIDNDVSHSIRFAITP